MSFDWQLWGNCVKLIRRRMGLSSSHKAVAYLKRRTGVEMCHQTYLRYENGERTPDAWVFIAMNLAFFGAPFPDKFVKMIRKEEE